MGNDEKIFVSALRILKFSDKSSKELKRKLEKKGFKNPEIDKTIRELQRLDYLNDKKFAENFIRYKISTKSWGQERIRNELRRKGIENEDIENALRTVLNEFNEDQILENEIEKYLLRKGSVNNFFEIRKIEGYLLRKGFRWDKIKE
ncbi:MAG: regulatory protein RecX, partial [Acidobacteriota bacterium]